MTKKTGVSNRRLLIAKNSIMMLVLLVVIFLAVFAWYNNNYSVTAKEVRLSAAGPDELEIAFTENGDDNPNSPIGNYVTTNGVTRWTAGAWGDKANFSGPFQFTNDVTSDGENFLIPKFISTENNETAKAKARTDGKIVNLNGIPDYGNQLKTNLNLTSEDIENGVTANYVKIPFYLRSRYENLCIKSSSYLAMAAEEGITDDDTLGTTHITGDENTVSTRRSSYGNFTSDALVAAMRVSITGGPVERFDNENPNVPCRPSGYEDKCTFVWVPRPDLFLNIPSGVSEDDWSLQTGVTKSTQLTRIGQSVPAGSTFKHNYYSLKEDSNNTVVGVEYHEDTSADNSTTAFKSDVNSTVSLRNGTVPTLGRGQIITSFGETSPSQISMKKTGSEEYDNFYVYKFYLNIWIEGTDSEARRAMDTGRFSLKLEFGNSAN